MNENYSQKSDKEIIDLITANDGSDEEAAHYLIFKRYLPALRNTCYKIFKDYDYLADLQQNIYYTLKKDNWYYLRNYQGNATFGRWLSIIAQNDCLKEVKRRNKFTSCPIYKTNDSPDDGDIESSKYGTATYTASHDDYRKTLLIEAIRLLENEQWQLMIIKRLEGYQSAEIATLLKQWYKSQGVERNFTEKGVNKIFSEKIYPELRKIIDNLKKRYKW